MNLKQNLRKRFNEWPTTCGGTSISIPEPYQATDADYELWDSIIEAMKGDLHPIERDCVSESFCLIPDWYSERHKLR